MAAVITLIDDLDNQGGLETRADVTGLRLQLGDTTVDLDLSQEHADELETMLRPYLKAGRRPDRAPRQQRTNRRSGITQTRRSFAENAALREWADAREISYRTTTGQNIYYSADLLRRWEAHKEAEGLTYE
jgi:hypothetical protein